jgi:hypothetical protein
MFMDRGFITNCGKRKKDGFDRIVLPIVIDRFNDAVFCFIEEKSVV